MKPLVSIPVVTLDGQTHELGQFLGKATLVVNVASKCGFTPQYAGLNTLYKTYKDRGFSILGFPCDQFAHQEPGDAKEIQNFCSLNYDVEFPLFAKIEVNGPGTHPLYRELKAAAPGFLGTQRVKWNFTKFLLQGEAGGVRRYAPSTKPEQLVADIEASLGK